MAEAVAGDSGFAFEHRLPSHDAQLLQSLNRQWRDSKFCDLLLLVRGDPIMVHSCVVSAFCPRVANILLSKSKHKNPMADGFAVEVDFSHDVMQCVLSAFYTGVLRPSVEILEELLEAVEWLSAADLISAVKQHSLELSDSNQTLLTPLFKNETGVSLEDTVDQNHKDTEAKALPQSTKVDQGAIESLLNLECDDSCVVQFEEKAKDVKTEQIVETKKTKIVKVEKGSRLKAVTDELAAAKKSCCYKIGNAESRDKDNVSTYELATMEKSRYSKIGNPGTRNGDCDGKTNSRFFKLEPVRTPSKKSCCYKIRNPDTRDGECDDKNNSCTSELMVVMVRDEFTELKVKSQRKRGRKSGSTPKPAKVRKIKGVPKKSAGKTPDGEKVGEATVTALSDAIKKKTKKTKKGYCNGDPGNLFEEVVDSDPMKQELDFLVNSSHVKCRRCFEKFPTFDLFTEHINNHPVFRCDVCGMEFARKFNLTRHVRYSHEGAAHLICKLCGTETDESGTALPVFKARTESEFRHHAREVHQAEYAFTCQHDGCKFGTWKYDRLMRHLQIHKEEKPWVCEKCGQGFSQYLGLVSHQRACYQLQQFLCDLCGQSFNHAQSMRAHRRTIHFGEKRFKCSVCSNKFSDQRNLRRHMRIHENSFPYTCPVCNQKYRHSNSLKAHIVAKHSDLPPEQLQIPNPQPRNKLGGRSFKRCSKAKNSTIAIETMLGKDGAPQMTSDEIGSGRQQKTKDSEIEGQRGDLHHQLPQYYHHQQQHDQLQLQRPPGGGTVGDILLPVTDQAGFEVASSELDIVMDQQTGLATLQVKTAATLDQGDSSQPVDSLREYAAFLEKQSSLYTLYPGPGPGSQHPQASASINAVSHPADSQLFSRQHLAHHSSSSAYPLLSSGFLSPSGMSSTSGVLPSSAISGEDGGTSEIPLINISPDRPPGTAGSYCREGSKREWRGKLSKACMPSKNSSSHQQHPHHRHHHQHQSSVSSLLDGGEHSASKILSSQTISFHTSVPGLLPLPAGAQIYQEEAANLSKFGSREDAGRYNLHVNSSSSPDHTTRPSPLYTFSSSATSNGVMVVANSGNNNESGATAMGKMTLKHGPPSSSAAPAGLVLDQSAMYLTPIDQGNYTQ